MALVQEKAKSPNAKKDFTPNLNVNASVIQTDLLRTMFPDGAIIGDPQQTGLAVVANSPHGPYVTATVKHPRHIFDKGSKQFGVLPQTDNMMEFNLLRPTGAEAAAQEAKALLTRQTMPTMGTELESYVYDGANGRLVPAYTETDYLDIPPEKRVNYQIETTLSLGEMPTNAFTSPEELAVARAIEILKRAQREAKTGHIAVEGSVPLTLGGEHPAESKGLQKSNDPYIQAMCPIFERDNFIPFRYLDPRVQYILGTYAAKYGYESIDVMLKELGVARVWPIAASHTSLGIPGETPPMETGIAIVNMFSSDFATVGEFLTQGTPLFAGEIVTVQENGEELPIRDVRTFLRQFLRTAYVTEPFIPNTEVLRERIVDGVVSGVATTPDRAAFPNTPPDNSRSVSAHARARLRGFAGTMNATTARVEYVGGSSTPSVYDVIARDAYLMVLWTAALEAVSEGKSPQEYFGAHFPSVAQWKNQRELAMSYSIHGFVDPNVNALVAENIEFLAYMKQSFPHLGDHIDFVVNRIENMGKPAIAETVDEYTLHPQGCIADVIIRMKKNGFSDVDILNQLNTHQLGAAEKVIEYQGDFSKMLSHLTNS